MLYFHRKFSSSITTDKLTERFMGPYKIKKIVSSNVVELELPNTMIHRASREAEEEAASSSYN